MQVETFECSEIVDETVEMTEEALALIESLELAGQKSLTTKKDGQAQPRSPYRKMTADEAFAYGVLCPEACNLTEYSATPIPLRVLQIAAHANACGKFERLEVWDRASVVVKDPVLVGIAEHPTRSWARETFILARWGEELEAFAVLLRRAVDSQRAKFARSLELVRSRIDAELAKVAGLSDEAVVEMGARASYDLSVPR